MATIQELLSGMADPTGMRSAIQQRLGYASNPKIAGLGVNLDFDRQINDLYRTGAEGSATLDTSEGNINRQYDQNLAQQAVDRDRTLSGLKNSFSSRGMGFSGAMLGELDKATSDFDRYVANIGADRDANLADVGKRRTNLLESLTRGRGLAEQGYSQGLGDYMNQEAIAAWVAETNAQQMRAAQAMGGGYGGGGGTAPVRAPMATPGVSRNTPYTAATLPPAVPTPAGAEQPRLYAATRTPTQYQQSPIRSRGAW